MAASTSISALKSAYLSSMRRQQLPPDFAEVAANDQVWTPNGCWKEGPKRYTIMEGVHLAHGTSDYDGELVVTVEGDSLQEVWELPLVDFYLFTDDPDDGGQRRLGFTHSGAVREGLDAQQKRIVKAQRDEHSAKWVNGFYKSSPGQQADLIYYEPPSPSPKKRRTT